MRRRHNGSQRVTTSHNVVISQWVFAPCHFPSSHNCSDCHGFLGYSALQRATRPSFPHGFPRHSTQHGVTLAHASGASGTRRVTTSRHIVRLLWVSAPHHFPSSPNCFDCIGLLGHSACQRFTRSCFHKYFRSRSMLHGVALAHAHGASGTSRVATSRKLVRSPWASAALRSPSSPNCSDCSRLLACGVPQRVARSRFHIGLTHRSMSYGVATAAAHELLAHDEAQSAAKL